MPRRLVHLNLRKPTPGFRLAASGTEICRPLLSTPVRGRPCPTTSAGAVAPGREPDLRDWVGDFAEGLRDEGPRPPLAHTRLSAEVFIARLCRQAAAPRLSSTRTRRRNRGMLFDVPFPTIDIICSRSYQASTRRPAMSRKVDIHCPACAGRLRVPTAFGTIRVACAHCAYRFEFRPDSYLSYRPAQTQPDQRSPSANCEEQSVVGTLRANAPQPSPSHRINSSPLAPVSTPPKPDNHWHAIEYLFAIATGIIVILAFPELGILVYVLAYVGGRLVGSLAHVPAAHIRRLRYKNSRCGHGIRGGVTRQLCPYCREAHQSEGREKAAREPLQTEKEQIIGSARELRDSERRRLLEQYVRTL